MKLEIYYVNGNITTIKNFKEKYLDSLLKDLNSESKFIKLYTEQNKILVNKDNIVYVFVE